MYEVFVYQELPICGHTPDNLYFLTIDYCKNFTTM